MDPMSTKTSLKRKLEEAMQGGKAESNKLKERPIIVSSHELVQEITEQLCVLNSAMSSSQSDRRSAARAVNLLCELAKSDDIVELIMDAGAVPILVKHLEPPAPLLEEYTYAPIPFEHEVEKGCAFTLGLLAITAEYQRLIVDAGGLHLLVNLLKKYRTSYESPALNGLLRRVVDAITNLSHDNANIKTAIRIEGAIPPLVDILEFYDMKVRRAAAGALRALAFRNDQNKNEIVQSNALPGLIMMLSSEDPTVHCEAIGAIGNLVHSSHPDIKREVLLAGALQPVIGLLSSSCSETQGEAALLLGQFAAADTDCKAHIGQRGAIAPLVEMLRASNVQLKEMACFALGRLAQDVHNQAGIAENRGLVPIIRLLNSKNEALQHNSAFCVHALSDNEDIVPSLIREGAVQKLIDGRFTLQQTKDCVFRTLKRLESKICGQVLKRILYLMWESDKSIQIRIVLALAHLSAPEYRRSIFMDNRGLELLLGLIESANPKQQQEGSAALYKLATVGVLHPADAAIYSLTIQMYLGERYLNDPTLSDVTFFVEGKPFYAHKTYLLAASDAFRAMFEGGYRETNCRDVEIPNIRWVVFQSMMRFLYTGSLSINEDIAPDLLKAADQYLLDGLKRCCEYTISQDISVNNLLAMYELSEMYNAMYLRQSCLVFVLAKFKDLKTKPWFSGFFEVVIPEIGNYIRRILTMPLQARGSQE